MSAETRKTIPFEQTVATEREPQSKNPVLLLGGGGKTGAEIVKLMAAKGYTVYVGTRSWAKFESLYDEVAANSTGQIKPFVADLNKPDKVQDAYLEMGLSERQAIDLFALAAEGFITTKRKVGLAILRLQKELELHGKIPIDLAKKETQELEELMSLPESILTGLHTNADSTLRLARALAENGNINSNSKIVVLDSTISKYAQRKSEYSGPWFYYPVGATKADGSLALRDLARITGATFIDFIAPLLRGTDAGDLIDKFRPVFEALNRLSSNESLEMPMSSTHEIAKIILDQTEKCDLQKGEIDFYIGYQPGIATNSRPDNFNDPIFGWL